MRAQGTQPVLLDKVSALIIAYFISKKEQVGRNLPILGLVVLWYVLRRWHRVAGGRTGRVAAGDGCRITARTDGCGIWIAALICGRSIAMITRRRVVGLHDHTVAGMRGVACNEREREREQGVVAGPQGRLREQPSTYHSDPDRFQCSGSHRYPASIRGYRVAARLCDPPGRSQADVAVR